MRHDTDKARDSKYIPNKLQNHPYYGPDRAVGEPLMWSGQGYVGIPDTTRSRDGGRGGGGGYP